MYKNHFSGNPSRTADRTPQSLEEIVPLCQGLISSVRTANDQTRRATLRAVALLMLNKAYEL